MKRNLLWGALVALVVLACCDLSARGSAQHDPLEVTLPGCSAVRFAAPVGLGANEEMCFAIAMCEAGTMGYGPIGVIVPNHLCQAYGGTMPK